MTFVVILFEPILIGCEMFSFGIGIRFSLLFSTGRSGLLFVTSRWGAEGEWCRGRLVCLDFERSFVRGIGERDRERLWLLSLRTRLAYGELL